MGGNGQDVLTRAARAILRTRWLARAPIHLYRSGFGWTLGSRLLLLEHRGRTSGRLRYVVLEVVDHPRPDRYVVVSGFGERAQWARNVAADPRVRVTVGHRGPVRALAHRLDEDASAAALARYARAHPRAWARLRPLVESASGEPLDERAGTDHPRGAGLVAVALDVVSPLPR